MAQARRLLGDKLHDAVSELAYELEHGEAEGMDQGRLIAGFAPVINDAGKRFPGLAEVVGEAMAGDPESIYELAKVLGNQINRATLRRKDEYWAALATYW